MNTALTTAIVACSLLAVASIPLGVADDKNSFLHPDHGLRNAFPNAQISFGSMNHDALVIFAPDLAFTLDETQVISNVLASDGRVIIIDEGDAGRALVEAISDMQISTGHLFSPFQSNGSMQMVGVEWPGQTTIQRASAIHGGTPVVVSKLAWIDQNDDGTPDLTEPRGEFAIAAQEGGLLVIASEEAVRNSLIVTGMQDFIGERAVWIDESHRRGIDPLGLSPVLSGQSSGGAPFLLGFLLITIIYQAFQPRLQRPKKAHSKPSNQLLEELSP